MSEPTSEELAREISSARFTPVRIREGYDMGEVDQFLDELERQVLDRQSVRALVDAKRFTPVRLREGYDMGDVDQFLERVATQAERLAGSAGTNRLREVQVTIDCADPGALCAFWREVLGYPEERPPAPFGTWAEALDAWGVPEDHRNDYSAASAPDKRGPRLFFQKVPEGKTSKNRVHLDVRAAPGLQGEERMSALETECERLVALGASRLERHEPGGVGAGHIIMADPEGNEFCLD